MYSISHHHALFDKYSLSTDTSFTMPTIGTVVSVKKDGSPASYFEDDKWNFNDLFNIKGAVESKYTINFHAQKHNPELLLELKQRAYWLIWGGKGSLLEVEGAGTFRKIESIINTLKNSNPVLRIFKGTRINRFRYLSNEIVFSQIIESLKGVGEATIRDRLNALSVLTQVNPQFPEHQRFTIPYQDGQTASSIAKKIAGKGKGKGKGHYPTVIPAIYEQFLSRTVNEVESAYLEFLNGRDFDADVESEYQSLLVDLDTSAEIEALYQELTTDVDIQERANKNICSEEDIRDDFMKKAQEAVEITYRNQAYQSVLEVYKTNNPLLDVKEYAKCNCNGQLNLETVLGTFQ